MKKFLLTLLSIVVMVLVGLYLAFLFYLPKKIDLSPYKGMLQKFVKEQVDLDVDFDDLKVTTTPSLSAGIQTKDISVKLPDGSLLFGADSFKGRVFLPSLFVLTAKVNCLEIQSPKINLDIKDGKQYKVVLLVEKLLNDENRKIKEEPKVKIQSEEPWFNPEWITIKVPNARIFDYKAKIDDPKSGHYLLLSGKELDIGYKSTAIMTKQKVRVKTVAGFYSDDKENITVDINISTFLPKFEKRTDEEDDPAERIEIPFVNPVLTYRTYDFKSDIKSKLKIRNKDGLITSDGYIEADDISMKVSGLKVPSGYVKLKTKGTKAHLNTDFYVAKNQNINLIAVLDYGKNLFLDTDIKTDKIYFDDVIALAKGVLDTMQVKNHLGDFKAGGYFQADTCFKTDFKQLKSEGSIIARNGMLSNKRVGLVISKVNANLIFDKNKFKVRDTYAKINNAMIKLAGLIDDNSNIELSVKSDKIPLPQLYRAFVPQAVIGAYNLQSGNVALDVKVNGEIKDAIASVNVFLTDLALNDSANNFRINDEKFVVNMFSDFKVVTGQIINKNFRLTLPKTNSIIQNPLLTLNVNTNDLNITDSDIKINNTSLMKFNAKIDDYMKSQKTNVQIDGKMATDDLIKLIGSEAKPFIDYKGSIPVKVSLTGHKKRMELIAQAFGNSTNYITPIEIDNIYGKNSVLQTKIIYKGNRLNIRETGLYENLGSNDANDNSHLSNKRGILTVDGTVASLNTQKPFINIIKVRIPREIQASLASFRGSRLNLNGRLIMFGQVAHPTLRGGFSVTQVSIPELFMLLQKGEIRFDGRSLAFNVDRLFLNHNDFNIYGAMDLNKLPQIFIRRLRVTSNSVDVDRLMKVVDAAMEFVPQSNSTTAKPASQQAADIPVSVYNGTFAIRKAKTGNITVDNTRGKLEFLKNVLYLTDMNTTAFKGHIDGNVTIDVINLIYKIAVEGSGMEVSNLLYQVCNMKDTLDGTLTFKTDLTLSGVTYQEQIKSLKGTLTFLIQNGQLGPFGKFENFLLAENIRQSEFFQNSIGGIVNSMLTIDTTHFKDLIGYLEFKDGIVNIDPITSSGNVMMLHIAGKFDILGNTTNMNVRGRLASMVTNVLGPLAQLNPINVVKATPGVDYLMLKAFSLFCEEVTQTEMDAIPAFEKDYDNTSATKFQVVLSGDVAKPLSLVKSFKWLAVASDIENAKTFMETLPPPTLDAEGHYVLQDPAVYAEEQRKANTPTGKLKTFFSKFTAKDKDNSKTVVPVSNPVPISTETPAAQSVPEIRE